MLTVTQPLGSHVWVENVETKELLLFVCYDVSSRGAKLGIEAEAKYAIYRESKLSPEMLAEFRERHARAMAAGSRK